MAGGGQITEFFATLGLKVNTSDVKKFDKTLDRIEERARKLAEGSLSNIKINISGFSFSDDFNRRMQTALKRRLSIISSKSISPEISISKFDINKNALLAEMRDAVRYVENNLRVNLRSDVSRPTGSFTGQRAIGGGISRFGAGLGLGSAAGGLGRGFIPGLGVAFGVSQMNRLNQELIGQDLAASAVFGGPAQGQEQLDWLRNLGNKIGFDYRSQANAYLKMQAAATTAGMDISGGQKIFTSMAEYGRVMGLSDEDMKGSMRAVEQMLNKGQVYAEELKMQLGEKFPAAIQLMAEAVAEGDTEKLFAMMERGEVKSLEALPRFAEILSRQARVGDALTEAMKTSLAEQMRFNNAFNDMVLKLSKAGFEEGQAGIFKTMKDFMLEMTPLIEGFGEAWLYVQNLIRIPLGLLHDAGVGLEALSDKTGIAKGKLMALGGYLTLLAIPFTRTITLIGTALAILEDFTAFLTGRDSLTGLWVKDLEEGNPQFLESVKTLLGNIKILVDLIFKGWSDLIGLLVGDGVNSPFLNELQTLLTELNKTLGFIISLTGQESANADQEDNSLFKIRRGSVLDWFVPEEWVPRYTSLDTDSSLDKGLEVTDAVARAFASISSAGILSFDNSYPMPDVMNIGGDSLGGSNMTINVTQNITNGSQEASEEFSRALEDASRQFSNQGQ